MQARGLSDDDAYAELRRESMRRRLDLEEFCESLFQPDSIFRQRGLLASRSQVHMTEEGLHMRKMLMLGAATAAMILTIAAQAAEPDQARRA